MNFNFLFKYFLRGLILVVPVSATIYLIFLAIKWVDGLLPIAIPGVGLLIVLAATILIGFLADSIIGKPLFNFINIVVRKIPIVNFIYTSLNDVISAVAGQKKRFNTPVLVPFTNDSSLLKPGFVTREDLSDENLSEYVAVYLPHSYNFSGNIFFVKKSEIVPLEGNNSEIMKYIVSAGLTGSLKKK